jgi:predicted metal-binding membrane protein
VSAVGRRAGTNGVLVAGALLLASFVAWIVTVQRMRGMDAGPGTDLGGLGWYLGVWVTMTAAMMLPSAALTVLLFARISGRRAGAQRPLAAVWLFVGGYLAVWTLVGLAAYALDRAVVSAGTGWLAWGRAGPYVVGSALVAASVYQVTPLKDVCLRHCRSPLGFLLHRRRSGFLDAVGIGAGHAVYCLGCCSGLMLALFALGVTSLFWTAVVAAVILVEKLAPRGRQLSRLVAVALLALGLWVAVAPASVPGLVQPASSRTAGMK